jgi:ribulose-bisphosphate carboxylase large chain
VNQDRVIATYWIETPYSIEHAAEVMAGEQSTGTFTAVPGETEQLKELYGARVIGIQAYGAVYQPSLPGAKPPRDHDGLYHQGEVKLSFPAHNFGSSIPNLLAAVAGNLFELKQISGLRLMDLTFPESFVNRYPGPKYGIAGTRKLAGVFDRPLIGTIIKPSIGLPLDQLGLLVRELAMSGLDFIKDDELNADPSFAPLEHRIPRVMMEIERAAEHTGSKVMYAFNITGDHEQLKRNHELVLKAGGTCVMVSINSVGFAGLAYLNEFSELPIHGHRNQWGMYTRCPALGMDFKAYQKLCRLAGADHLHVNGLNSKFYESNASVIASVQSVMSPLMSGGYSCMPVLSSGQWAGTAIDTYQAVNTIDVIHLAGGGILAHPDGASAGATSMRQGWEAAVLGIDLYEYARNHMELQRAIDTFSDFKASNQEGS